MNKVWESTTGRWSQGTQRRRSNSIFTPMSVAHVDSSSDEDSSSDLTSSTATTPSPAELYNAEKVFKNGDFYTGQWLENFPHGHGKYLWSDGCMYVGEWSKGKTNGNGTFSWPSGATYEGEFRGGYMDGRGTYTASNGDTYRGNWVMNLKHGQGNKSYTNGDYYEGEWKRDSRDGQGRYQWSNGNHYIGQWKDGEMNGNGTFIWVGKGNRYDGYWEGGLMKGSGTYRWDDGSFYVGVWSKERDERSGTYYGAGGRETNGEWDQDEVYELELKDCVVSEGEEIVGFPSQKMVNWPSFDAQMLAKNVVVKVDGKNRRRSVDDRLMNGGNGIKVGGFWDDDHDCGTLTGMNKNGKFVRQGSDASSVIGRELQFHPVVLPKEIKRQGETISKGHKNYELMLNLQLGIRHSVGRPAPATAFDLKASAFDPKEKLWTKFPSEGSKYTPPHSSAEFKWKDYCPLVFRTLRKLFKVDAADYMLSICGDEALRELSSPGKSGSFFYLTNDDKYMIKTMKKAEVKVLLRMLPAYYNHVRAYENTLVTKFFGLHCVKLTGPAQKKVRFVIMGNLFCTKYAIHRRFDLKGSSHGRTTEKPESEIDPTTTLKDLDLNYIFRLQKCWSQEFHRQVDRDCEFLELEGIMDYSLLVGVHFREAPCSKEVAKENGFQENEVITPRMSRLDQSDEVIDPDLWTSVRLGINMPVRAELTVRRKSECEGQFLVGDPTGQCFDVVVFFGIIDILQDYDISKKLEHAYKSIQYDPTSISAVDPKQYSRRFRDFIFKVFTEDA